MTDANPPEHFDAFTSPSVDDPPEISNQLSPENSSAAAAAPDLLNAAATDGEKPDSEENCWFCAICLGADKEQPVQTTVCSHMFHAKCLEKWLETKLTCPNCRRVLQDAKPTPVYKFPALPYGFCMHPGGGNRCPFHEGMGMHPIYDVYHY